jgi:pimeloyl-ACP methyl ester carboxylesterase
MNMNPIRISRPNAPTLNLQEWGRGSTTCFLVHGFGDGGFVWNEFAEILAARCRTIAIDLRGHGNSGWDAVAQYGISTHLADVMYAVDVLRLENIILIGHSMGGELAIRLAALCPQLLIGLVVIDYGPELDSAAIEHIRREFIADHQNYATPSEYAELLKKRRPLPNPAVLERLANNSLRQGSAGGYELKSDPAMGISQTSDASELPELWSVLQRISSPTLIIRGIASSVLQLAVAKRMKLVLRSGQLVSVNKAGHAVMIDNPEAFSAAAMPFIRDRIESHKNGAVANQ